MPKDDDDDDQKKSEKRPPRFPFHTMPEKPTILCDHDHDG